MRSINDPSPSSPRLAGHEVMLHSKDWLCAQQALRRSMLDSGAVAWAPARDLTAHLLLRLNSPQKCWLAAADWLCTLVSADRVDGGHHASLDLPYTPQVEVQRTCRRLPTALTSSFMPRAAGDVAVWGSGVPTFIGDVARESRMNEQTRGLLQRLDTRSKLALPILHEQRMVGMLCADWCELPSEAQRAQLAALTDVASSVLGPLLTAAHQLGASHRASTVHTVPAALQAFTRGEMRVARLIVQGLSYKEVARQLGCSFSTVDHHLRNIRGKLGVSSTARLSVQLARLLPAEDAG